MKQARLLCLLCCGWLLSSCATQEARREPAPRPADSAIPGAVEAAVRAAVQDASIVHAAEDVSESSDRADVSLEDEDPKALAERPQHTPPDPQPPTDLWARIRAGFALAEVSHPRMEAEVHWFASHQDYLDRVADRAQPYLYHIVEAIEARGMPSEIALLPIVESAFQPFAYSHGRAAGIWQFIPGTGRRYGLKQNWWYDGRRDVFAATRAALDYLEKLHRQFDGDWLLALAAYNSGEGTVAKAIARNRRRGKPTQFWSLYLPRETRGYVPRLLAVASLVREPERYGVRLKPISNEPYFAKVEIDGQIDLALAAELAGVSMETLYRLNPGFNRWATAPNGPHRLLLPVEHAARFQEQLQSLPPEERVRWVRHRIRRGETLSHIAARYRITVRELRRVNKLRGTRIVAGRNLIIPVARHAPNAYPLSVAQRKRAVRHTSRAGRQKAAYTVHRGDTLWEIAMQYGVGVRQLAKWNAMAPTDLLRPGQELVLWLRKPTATASRTAAPAQSSRIRRIHYVVRRGDSLARIARRFKVTISDLLRWNALSRDKYLQPGQLLKLFVDVTRQTGT